MSSDGQYTIRIYLDVGPDRSWSSNGPDCTSPRYLDAYINTIVEELLSFPLTPVSTEFKGPEGKPLGIEVAINAYNGGKCSTGLFFREFVPEKLNWQTGSVSSVQRIAEEAQAVIPTIMEDPVANPMEGTEARKYISTGDISDKELEQVNPDHHQDWYRSVLPGQRLTGREREFEEAIEGRLALPATTKPEDKLPPQKGRIQLNNPLPPLPTTRPLEDTCTGHKDKVIKPAAISLPSVSSYNSTHPLPQHAISSQNSPGPAARPSPLSQPVMPITELPWSFLGPSESPRTLESVVHPAFRSHTNSSGHQDLLDMSGYQTSCKPSYSYRASGSSSFTEAYVSPSLSPQRFPSSYLHSPPVSPAHLETTPFLREFNMRQDVHSSYGQDRTHDLLPDARLVCARATVAEAHRTHHHRNATATMPPSRPLPSTPIRSSSLAMRRIHNEGVEQFNHKYTNILPRSFTATRPASTPSMKVSLKQEEVPYIGGGEKKIEQVLGSEASASLRHGQVDPKRDQERTVGAVLDEGKKALKRGSEEVVKVSLNRFRGFGIS